MKIANLQLSFADWAFKYEDDDITYCLFARPIGQGPCDQRCEKCLDWENSFGPEMTVIPNLNPHTRIDKDHGQQFYIVTLQP